MIYIYDLVQGVYIDHVLTLIRYIIMFDKIKNTPKISGKTTGSFHSKKVRKYEIFRLLVKEIPKDILYKSYGPYGMVDF